VETIEVLSDADLLEGIASRLKDIKAGRIKTNDRIFMNEF
jgi:hypothetical protein